MEMKTLRELYISELKDLYSAENQLVQALPKMARNSTNAQLRQAFENHLDETKRHVERLNQIFQGLEARPGGKHCKGIEGLIDEADELLEEDAQEDVLDAGLISKAQHVEHYEMAGYGTVRTYAEILGEVEHAQLLQQTLEEEIAADLLLTELAEGGINIDATIGDEDQASRGIRGDRKVARAAEVDRSSTTGESRQRPGYPRDTGEETREL